MFVISFPLVTKRIVDINSCLTRFYNRSEMIGNERSSRSSECPSPSTLQLVKYARVRPCLYVFPFSLIRDSG